MSNRLCWVGGWVSFEGGEALGLRQANFTLHWREPPFPLPRPAREGCGTCPTRAACLVCCLGLWAYSSKSFTCPLFVSFGDPPCDGKGLVGCVVVWGPPFCLFWGPFLLLFASRKATRLSGFVLCMHGLPPPPTTLHTTGVAPLSLAQPSPPPKGPKPSLTHCTSHFPRLDPNTPAQYLSFRPPRGGVLLLTPQLSLPVLLTPPLSTHTRTSTTQARAPSPRPGGGKERRQQQKRPSLASCLSPSSSSSSSCPPAGGRLALCHAVEPPLSAWSSSCWGSGEQKVRVVMFPGGRRRWRKQVLFVAHHVGRRAPASPSLSPPPGSPEALSFRCRQPLAGRPCPAQVPDKLSAWQCTHAAFSLDTHKTSFSLHVSLPF